MILVAETSPTLQQVCLLAEFSSRQARPELKHLLNLGKNGALDLKTVANSFRISERAAYHLLSECESLSLIDKDGNILPDGMTFLKDSQSYAFVPEHGSFNVLIARHPSFGQALLDVERTQDNIELDDINEDHDVILKKTDKSLGHAVQFKFSKYLTPNRRGGIINSNDWSAKLYVELNGPNLNSVKSSLKWTRGTQKSDEDSPNLKISPQKLRDEALQKIPSEIGVWKLIPQPHLAIKFKSAKPEEASQFIRNEIVIPGPHEIDSEDDLWDQFTLRNIPLGPTDESEARAWTDALFFKAIQAEGSYLNLSEATELYNQTQKRNPILTTLAPVYQHTAILRNAGLSENRKSYWALQAPSDLENNRPTEESIRIKPLERMSFHAFLSKIIGSTPKGTHFVLYDRFALRNPNFHMVSGFLDACTALDTQAKLTIIYQPQKRELGPDPKPHSPLIAHKNCYEVFGQSPLPHDRYLFAVCGDDVKAWQFSNSPLAAKIDSGENVDASTILEWPSIILGPVAVKDLENGFQTLFQR